ncbi:mechanosensitive ion channel family protein [Vagococcus intermedius]|uniref:Mechanosensitive ion channel family protein n=1 Tax=Vagococcus intermedius TaxID=2991418 RepID=A0AAF0CVA1_9ENTE|nr:mechanosensitive ion channel domain-containing protein [Vagococcus intermedius]WEG73660.1 mechanosensitive ion channel family protein [Vagococcus intermedius]WEG75744.1 mechanosensitive ion channel family protein [Vagococcus intermedius]
MEDSIRDYFVTLSYDIADGIRNPEEYSTKISMMLMILTIGFSVEYLGLKVMKKHFKSVKTYYKIRPIFKSLIRGIMILMTLKTWMQALDTFILLIFIALLFISIFVKGMINNLIAWFIIEKRKHFRIYDRLEINGVKGEVIKIGFIHFTMVEINNWLSSDSPTGRTIKIPNSVIFDDNIFNYTALNHFIWHEISYTLTHESDWQQAQVIMKKACDQEFFKQKNRTFPEVTDFEKEMEAIELSDGTTEPTFLMDVTEVGIDVKIRYLVHYKEGAATKTVLHQAILTDFNNSNTIHFANFNVEIVKVP